MNEPLDLTACDKERIHEIAFIQEYGSFVAVSGHDLKIKFASENLPAFFQRTDHIHLFMDKKLNELISHDLFLKIQKKIKSGLVSKGRGIRFNSLRDNLEVYIFDMESGLYGLEFEQILIQEELQELSEDILKDYVSRMRECESLNELASEASRAVRHLTGMDRVMIYRFFPPTMYGEVIAEDKNASAHSFMHHRFPATDIPKPARDLYLRNHLRFIFDSHSENSAIYPKADAKKVVSLNMSDSKLRGVSPIHIEYLRNMGVRGSLSIAIIVNNSLWGLIACHCEKPQLVSHGVRSMCEIISDALALGASSMEKFEKQRTELAFYSGLHSLFSRIKGSRDPLNQIFKEGPSLLELFSANGMVLVSKHKLDYFGITPLPADLKRIWSWANNKMEKEGKDILSCESLSTEDSGFEEFKDQVSGVLAIRVSEKSDMIFLITRSEYLETIKWGGDPRKNIDARHYKGKINPRASFDTWTEILKNSSRHWEDFEISGIQNFRDLVFESLWKKEELLQELELKLENQKN